MYEFKKRIPIAGLIAKSLFFFLSGLYFKGKMLLAQITDSNYNNRGEALAEKRPPAKHFNKYFKDKIIECKIKYE